MSFRTIGFAAIAHTLIGIVMLSYAQTVGFHIDRSHIPPLNYSEVTLKVNACGASSASVTADNQPIASRIQNGSVILTTTGTAISVTLTGATSTANLGKFSKAVLYDDRKWAWSHGFDDNEGFKQYAIPAFQAEGFPCTMMIIGSSVSMTRDENWIVDAVDFRKLVQQGWGIGNHTWSHAGVSDLGGWAAATADIKKCDSLLRVILAPVAPKYRLMSFAAPMFDNAYQPIIDSIRNSDTSVSALHLMFNESGDGSPGVGQPNPPELGGDQKGTVRVDTPLDPNMSIGRNGGFAYAVGDGKAYEDPIVHVNNIRAHMDSTHHYWYNTFCHGIDYLYPDSPGTPFPFIPMMYNNYGAGGTNEMWMATSEHIISYLTTRDKSVVTVTGQTPLRSPVQSPSALMTQSGIVEITGTGARRISIFTSGSGSICICSISGKVVSRMTVADTYRAKITWDAPSPGIYMVSFKPSQPSAGIGRQQVTIR